MNPSTIAEAAKYLDNYDPTWYTNIDLDKLCMSNGKTCILGQLSGTQFHSDHPLRDAGWYEGIFSANAPRSEWVREIQNRLGADVSKINKTTLYRNGKSIEIDNSDYDFLLMIAKALDITDIEVQVMKPLIEV